MLDGVRGSVGSLVLAGAFLAAAPAAGAGDAGEFAARYAALHASRDVEGMVALHTADVEFVVPGQPPLRGEAALRDLLAWDAELGTRLEIEGAREEEGAIVLGPILERNRLFDALGVGPVRHPEGTRLTLREGRIARTELPSADAEAYAPLNAALGAALDWLARYRAAELGARMPGGAFRYDAESARWWLGALADRAAARAASTPESEAAERLGRELMAAWSSGETARFEAIVAPDAIYEENAGLGRFAGPEGFARYVGHVHGWARDVEIALDRVTIGPGHAHFEWTMTAIQDRPIPGRVPVATHRPVTIRGATLVESREGRIVRASDHLDALGFVLGLGARVELPGGVVMPVPGAPRPGE